MLRAMKFAAAILVFVLFALFMGWGIVEVLQGRPWLLIAALGIFMGTFIKYGCQSH
jgi:hypothetical protein